MRTDPDRKLCLYAWKLQRIADCGGSYFAGVVSWSTQEAHANNTKMITQEDMTLLGFEPRQ